MKFSGKVLAFVWCVALGALLSCASSVKQQIMENEENAAPPNLEQITEIARSGTVQIGSLSVDGPPGLGSGFFISPDMIVTNIHVINRISYKGTAPLVKPVNKPIWYTVTGVVTSDPIRDLVILKVTKLMGRISNNTSNAPNILSIGNSGTVKASGTIITIGSAHIEGKYRYGIVSKGRIVRLTPHFLRVKADNIRSGYSGGPVLNVHGEVIGIMSRGNVFGSGYAVPSNYLQTLLKEIPTQTKSLEEWREEPLIRYYSAEYTAHSGELASAMKGFDTAIRLAPDFADAYINRANARDMLGNFEEALKDYNTAIRLGADYAFVYARRAGVKSDLGNYKDAIKDYNNAIRLKPASAILASIYINRGSAKFHSGDYKDAIEDYNNAIRLKPEDVILAVAYVNRADAKSDLGDHKGAIEDCNTVISLAQEDSILAEAYNVRGKAKSAQGDNISGITDYDKAIQLEQTHPEFYYNRGIANTALGRNSEAKTDLKAALKLLKQAINISKSVEDKTDLANMRIELDVRPDLKTDIEKALRLLE